MIAALAVLLVSADLPAVDSLAEARRALTAGRIEQAQLMADAASASGTTGVIIDRLRADLAYAAGHDDEAARRYESLLAITPGDATIAEHAGLAALRLGDASRAARLLALATAQANASWRAWNGLGALADATGDWAAADAAFDHAQRIAPNEPALLNNRGWSQLLRGNWPAALPLLEAAAAAAPQDRRMANNLELARAGLAGQLPLRRPGEVDRLWAARLNDAGMAALARHDRTRAVAAFARAIVARNEWYERASNNLAQAQAFP